MFRFVAAMVSAVQAYVLNGESVIQLAQMNLEEGLTVSGISSGGYMAV